MGISFYSFIVLYYQFSSLERVVVLKDIFRFKPFFFILWFTAVSSNALADSSSEYFEKALASFSQDDIETTYIHLKNSLKENEDNLPAKILMGKVLLRSGYLYEAETILQEALEAGADQNLIVDTLGKVWLFTKQNEKVIDARFNSLNKQGEIDWLVIVATAKLNLKRVEDARKDYEKVLRLDPDSVRTLNALTSLELNSQNFVSANDYLIRSIDLEANNPTTWRLKGDLSLSIGELDDAVSAYLTSFDLDPDNPLIKRSLVTVYLQKQDIVAAQNLLDSVLSQTPDDPTAILLNAWLLSKEQKNEAASKLLEELSSNLAGLTEEALRDDPSLIYISGLSAFAQHNYQQAKTYFIQYLIFVPNNVDAVSLLGQTYMKLGESRPALESMQRHEKELLTNLDSALLLGELYLDNNKAFKTVELLGRLRQEYPDEPRVDLLEIKTLIARGRNSQALKMLDSSPLINTNFAFIMTKAQLFLNTELFVEANDIADQLVAMAPSNTEFLNLKAAVLIKLRAWNLAEIEIEKALVINPLHYSARFNLATVKSAKREFQQALDILKKLNQERPDKIEILTMLARSQASLGETENALKNLERVLEKDIGNEMAMQLTANIYVQQEKFQKAIRQINNAIKTSPKNPRYQMQRIELYIKIEKLERAKRELSNVAKLVGNDPENLLMLSKIQLKAGQFADAQQSVKIAHKASPNDRAVVIEYIRVHMSAGNNKDASEMLNSWLAKEPENPQFITLHGDILAMQGKLEDASKQYALALTYAPNYNLALAKLYNLANQGVSAEQFAKVANDLVDANPNNVFQRNLLADHYVNNGQFDKGLPHYEILLRLENMPNRAFMLNNMANIYIPKDLAKAENYINQALEISSNEAAMLDTQGWITSLKGDWETALTILRRAYAMKSDDPSIQYHLAFTLSKLGRNGEALSTLEKALSSNKQFHERADAESLKSTL